MVRQGTVAAVDGVMDEMAQDNPPLTLIQFLSWGVFLADSEHVIRVGLFRLGPWRRSLVG
jgi:hypothetical protein